MTDQTMPRARIIIELQDDGSMIIESYSSGQRTREQLFPGFEMIAIKDALQVQKAKHEALAQRKIDLQVIEARERHKRVWHHAAAQRNQGEEFANRVIGPLKPNGSPSGLVVPQATITDSTGLL